MNPILIVDDERLIAELIELTLLQAGYQCEIALDGDTAADKIEAGHYDLILLDIMLPGVSGYELMEYIQPTGTPVIFLTAKGMLADRVRGLRMGADDYMVKPFEPLELLARVESVLRRTGRGSGLLRASTWWWTRQPAGWKERHAGSPHAPGIRPSGTAFAQPGRGTVPRRAVRACLGRRDG